MNGRFATPRWPRRTFALSVLTALAVIGPAEASAQLPGSLSGWSGPVPYTTPDPPRIALVLGGGGARGMAHVGVLQVLEELRVPVDLVVGTSIGALAGGLFAAGVEPADMEAWIERADWDELFRDQPSYSDLSFRRKEEARAFPVPLEVGVGRRGIQLPRGLVAGQKLNAALRELSFRAARVSDFDSLAVPFRAVTTDLDHGTTLVLGSGDLVDAMRASMSVPGAFTPYPVGEHVLVDGGLLRNLPVDIALAMGADIIICVDVGSELDEGIGSPAQLLNQVTRIMMRRGGADQRELLTPDDILIVPDLDDIGSTDFDRSLDAVAAGESAARALEPRLRQLAMDSAAYARRLEARLSFGEPTERVDFVNVGPYTGRSPASILDRIATRPGRLDTVTLHRDIADLYGLGIYERVDYQLAETAEGTSLRLRVREKAWGPAYMRFRMSIRDRLDGEGTYSFAAHLLVPQMNSWGAELVADLEVGEVRGARAELFQPLGVRGLFFVAPRAELRSVPGDMFVDGHTVARFRNTRRTLGLEAGMHIGQDFELAAGIAHGRLEAERAIGDPAITGFDTDLGLVHFRAVYDGLDDPIFPRSGMVALMQYDGERSWLGAESVYDRYAVEVLHTVSRGRMTLFTAFTGATSGDRPLPAYGKVGLGGFLMLSGYPPGSIAGNHMAAARTMIFRVLGDDNVYAGVSFEAGNAWEDRDEISLTDLRFSSALVLGLRTPLGPIYLGYGTRGHGSDIAYLVVGSSL